MGNVINFKKELWKFHDGNMIELLGKANEFTYQDLNNLYDEMTERNYPEQAKWLVIYQIYNPPVIE